MKSGVGQEKQITSNSHGTNLKQGLTLLNEEQFDEIMLYLQLTTTQIRFKLSLDQFGEFFLSLQLGTAIYSDKLTKSNFAIFTNIYIFGFTLQIFVYKLIHFLHQNIGNPDLVIISTINNDMNCCKIGIIG